MQLDCVSSNIRPFSLVAGVQTMSGSLDARVMRNLRSKLISGLTDDVTLFTTRPCLRV